MNSLLQNKFKLALEKKNIPVLEFMINENMINNIDVTNSNNETIYHLFSEHADKLENMHLSFTNLKKLNHKLINIKNNNGNTALHIAVGGNNTNLINLLQQHGGDRSILNNEGSHIENLVSIEIDDSITKTNKINTNTISSLDLTLSTANSTKYFDNLVHKIKSNKNTPDSYTDTEVKYNHTGGNNTFISDKISNTMRGKRMLRTVNYVASENDFATHLSYMIKNQTNQIFDRIVSKISQLLNVDNETARYYKTTLIKMAQRKNPNVKNLELANEVEKLVTNDVLKKIDIDKEKEIIKKWREQRPNNTKQSNSKPNKSKQPTTTEQTATSEKREIKKPKKVSKISSESSYSKYNLSTSMSNTSEETLSITS